MQSMKGVTRNDIINILDDVIDAEDKNGEEVVGTLFSTKECGSNVCHNVIVLYSDKEIL